jgi:hypothetical protein
MQKVVCRFKGRGGFSLFKRVVYWMGGFGERGGGLKNDSKHPLMSYFWDWFDPNIALVT